MNTNEAGKTTFLFLWLSGPFSLEGKKNSRVFSRLLGTGFPVTNQQTSFFFPLSLYQYKAINLSSLPVCHKSRHEPYNLQLGELKREGKKKKKREVSCPSKRTNKLMQYTYWPVHTYRQPQCGGFFFFFYSSTLLK